MHRQTTRLSSRVNRVAAAVERRGIVATYTLHDRLLSNRKARQRHGSAPLVLDDLQRHIVDSLDYQGYVVLPFADLISDASLCQEIDRMGDAFVAETEAALQSGEGLKVRPGKEFVARRYSFEGATITGDDPWFRAVASRRMLDVANAYLRLWPKLSYVDLWYTAPQEVDEERVASQNWHYDFDDKHLLKAFLYLTDVDAETGPFEYVPGSQPGGRYHDVRPWTPMGYGRVSDEDVAKSVPRDDIVTFTAPRGTLIFCNTSGLHRGGFATARPRVLATATYCSPASLASLSRRNFTPALDLASLDDVARYALS
jgi:Phytanoyl-CoA dioxygenase (PhyH)